VPALQLLALEPSLEPEASLKGSWVPKKLRHPEIPLISAKPRNCNNKLLVWKGEKLTVMLENILGKQESATAIDCSCWKNSLGKQALVWELRKQHHPPAVPGENQ